MMRTEQDKVAWSMEILQKFTELENVNQYACVGACSVAEASRLHSSSRIFIGGDVDPKCVTKTMPHLILMFTP